MEFFEPDMDLAKMIGELRNEKDKIDKVIALLEPLEAQMKKTGSEKAIRRGRKSMSDEERSEVSARMLRYWAGRRRRGKS